MKTKRVPMVALLKLVRSTGSIHKQTDKRFGQRIYILFKSSQQGNLIH
jgi:hypothetical protein